MILVKAVRVGKSNSNVEGLGSLCTSPSLTPSCYLTERRGRALRVTVTTRPHSIKLVRQISKTGP